MNLKIAEAPTGPSRTFSLSLNEVGDIVLEDSEGWQVVALRVVDGQINLVRYSCLGDSAYNLDDDGRIREVEE